MIELNRISEDIRRIESQDSLSDTDIADLRRYVVYLGKDWLIAHVMKEDLRMKGFMGDGDE